MLRTFLMNLNRDDFENYNNSFKVVKSSFKSIFKKAVETKYEKLMSEKLSNLDNTSKLFLYSKLKREIKLEDYLLTMLTEKKPKKKKKTPVSH